MALKREVEELKTMVNDLKDQVTRMDREHEERMDRHREYIDWQRQECILLRVGLQENEDSMAELSVRGEQMSRRLCRCADRQGPPISAVGSPLPPPYARSPSLEFHTSPIELCLIEDAETPPSSPGPILVPPPAPKSPIPFSDAENIHLACCANPPAPRAPLQPIEEVVSDAEDSDAMAERLEDQIRDETALSFLTGSNQGRGACRRAVCGLAHRAAPYPHRMQAGDCPRPRSFKLMGERLQRQRNHRYDLRRGGYQCSSSESDSSSKDCILLDGPPT